MLRLCLFLLVLFPAVSFATSAVGSKSPLQLALAQGEFERVKIEAGPGDYVVASFSSSDGRFSVHLRDGEAGSRRLLHRRGGSHEFYWLSSQGDEFLEIVADRAGTFALSLKVQPAGSLYARPVESEEVASGAGFLSPSLAALAANDGAKQREVFWRNAVEQGTPLIEPDVQSTLHEPTQIVTFLYRGAKYNVRLHGGPSADHDWLHRFADSDIWFRSYRLPSSTRLSYRLSPDVPQVEGTWRQRRLALMATSQIDPHNRHPWPDNAPDRFNQYSTFALEDAPAQPGFGEAAPLRGQISRHLFRSDILGNERDLTLYRPAEFRADNPDNHLLIVFDAYEFERLIEVPLILDSLIVSGQLPPMVAVLVGNPDLRTRSRELPNNPDFARALVEELLPWVEGETGMKASAAQSALAGSSYGGLGSTTVAMRYPQVFGNVICLSGSFWWHPPSTPPSRENFVAADLAAADTLALRFFMSAGLFESGRGDSPGILETSRHLRDVLIARRYPLVYREYAGSHDHLVWRGALGDGLLALFGSHKKTEFSK